MIQRLRALNDALNQFSADPPALEVKRFVGDSALNLMRACIANIRSSNRICLRKCGEIFGADDMKFGDIPEGLKFENESLEKVKWGERGGKVEVMGDPNKFAGASEHSQQVALFAAVAQYVSEVPELKWYHAIPNGGTRGGDKRSAMIAGANMKAEGAKKGISDTCLPVARHGYHGFYIELKAPGKLKGESLEQKAFGAFLRDEGYLYAVFDSWHAAFRALMWYLNFEHTKRWALP